MEKELINKPVEEITESIDSSIGLSSKVLLFNDNWHTFDEVIYQLIKATQCSFEKARSYAFEVHVKGKSIVFSGQMSRCIKVSSILEEIGLITQIIT